MTELMAEIGALEVRICLAGVICFWCASRKVSGSVCLSGACVVWAVDGLCGG